MSPELEIVAKIFSPAISTVILIIAKSVWLDKAKVQTFVVQAAGFVMPPNVAATSGTSTVNDDAPVQLPAGPPPQVNTHTIVVRNAGRKPAHNVRIGHERFPALYQVIPPVQHTKIPGQHESAEILLPILVAKEQVTISYLYFPPLYYNNIHSYVKSDEGMAKFVNVFPNERPSRTVISSVFVLAALGLSLTMYWLFVLAVFLIKIPGVTP